MKYLWNQRNNYLVKLFLFYVAVFTLARVVLFALWGFKEQNLQFFEIIRAFYIGAKFDMRFAAFIIIPSLILSLIPLSKKITRRIHYVIYGTLSLFIIEILFSDFAYFAYLRSRINATVFSFLDANNKATSLKMVWESYPVIWMAIGGALAVYGTYRFIKFIFKNEAPFETLAIKHKITATLSLIIILAAMIYGNISYYPLRWSDAFFSTSSFVSNLALNPILYIGDTFTFRHAAWDLQKVRAHYNEVAAYLGVKNPNAEELNFERSFIGDSEKRAKAPNFVIIVKESTSYNKTSMGGNELNPTPALLALTKESMLFNHFYTPTVATARSIFALVTSLPDVSRIKTVSRNPLSVEQHSVAADLVDHDKFYFLGGSASWGNIRGIFSHNIPGLKIYEEGSYSSPKVDVWGISDLSLMKEAINVFKTRDSNKPFFSVIQTSGFHRPYTIPKERDSFRELKDSEVSSEMLKRNGFDSLAQLNSLRFQDYSVGKFIELLKKEKFYENTIVMIFGDHGIPGESPTMPEWEKVRTGGYHVPFIIHGPKFNLKGLNTKFASEMDVLPTVAGLAGVPYKTRSFGKDLFNTELDHQRQIFNYDWYPPYTITLSDETYAFATIPEKDGTLKRHDLDQKNEDVTTSEAAKYEEYYKLTEGLYETARYLINHNSNEFRFVE